MTRMTSVKRRARELQRKHGVKYMVARRWVLAGLSNEEIETRAEAHQRATPPQPDPDEGQGEDDEDRV